MKQELAAEGTELSKQRRAAAGQLRVAVETCLADLAMAGSRFDVRIGWEPYAKVRHPAFHLSCTSRSCSCWTSDSLSPHVAALHVWTQLCVTDMPCTIRLRSFPAASGEKIRAQGLLVPGELAEQVYEEGNQGFRVRRSGLDTVEFLLAAGPAEPLRPLGAVASGGESARVMLALKAAPALAAASAGSAPEEQRPSTSEGACLQDAREGLESCLGCLVSQIACRHELLPLQLSSFAVARLT